MKFLALTLALIASPASAADWLSFRGSSSVASSDDVTLLPESDTSIVEWEVPTGGNGISSPIIVPGTDGAAQVIVTSTGGQDQRDITIESFDAVDGIAELDAVADVTRSSVHAPDQRERVAVAGQRWKVDRCAVQFVRSGVFEN